MRRRSLLGVGGKANVEGCLAFEALSATKFKFSGTSSSTVSLNTLQYSIDGAAWQDLANDTYTSEIRSGQKIYFKGNCTPTNSTLVYHGIGKFFSSGGTWNVEGTPMSLLFGNNFSGQTSLSGKDGAFSGLFSNCTRLTSAENLSLPATTLKQYCYQNMFNGCTSLTTSPTTLPATTLEYYCYSNMFSKCSALTTAPSFTASTLSSYCCNAMFSGCTSLVTTQISLPATTLAASCYSNMFNGCTSLTTAPSFTASTLSSYCCNAMFSGCTSLTSASISGISLPATTLAQYCYQNMFASCTSLTTAPSFTASTVESGCCQSMFASCSGLTSAGISGISLPATTLASGCYSEMFYGCSNLNSITCLATDISATNCTKNWVNGVASSGTFTKASSMTSWTTGVNGIPSNWTVVNAT